MKALNKPLGCIHCTWPWNEELKYKVTLLLVMTVEFQGGWGIWNEFTAWTYLFYSEWSLCELGTLWLDVKEIKKKLIYHVKVIFFRPENKILNSAKVFLVSFLFHYNLLYKKINGTRGSGGSTVCWSIIL